MWNRKNVIRLLLLLVSLTLIIVNNYLQDGWIKQVCNAIGIIVGLYTGIKFFWPRAPFVTKLDYELRQKEVFNILLGEEQDDVITTGEPFEKFKSSVLNYTADQLEKLNDLIQNPEIFNFNFPIIEKFTEGYLPENRSKDWKNHLNKQFLFITGQSGSGKTFELIKRINYLSEQLAPGRINHELLSGKKLPLYIELKSLDRKLDNKWIANYVSKTASSINHQLNEKQLLTLIKNKEVIYFFDGLDEVQLRYQDKCVEQLIEISKDTGVHVTCRKRVYKRFKDRDKISREKLPAEYFLTPLSLEWVKGIISELRDRSDAIKAEMINYIDHHPKVQRHLSRSIFLNMFIQVYVDLSDDEKRRLDSDDEDVSMDVLWERYEDVIVKTKLPPDSDNPGIRTITVWLAKIMGDQSFYIESIQPHWLRKIKNGEVVEDKIIQGFYFVITRIIAAVIIGIALSCVIATPVTLLSASVIGGIVISVIAGIYNRMTAISWIKPWLSGLIFSILMISLLIIFCGGYQGFVLPRSPEEMVTSNFSATEAWPGILLGITLSTIFSYRIILEKIKKQYILPVELFHFDWGHAFKYGLSWGGASGFITGTIAIYIRHTYAKTRFISKWLEPHLQYIVQKFGGHQISEKQLDTAVFIYAFSVTFFVASMIIILLAGRFNDEPESDVEKKQKLNYGIVESRRHALKHASQVGIVSLILYACGVLFLGLGNWFLCVKISFGIAMLAFLWFGGMEVINHRLLRINLFLRGIAPYNYDPWVQAQKRMGMIIPSGFQMQFYHSSLAGYYSRYRMLNNSRIRLKKKNIIDYLSYSFLSLIVLFLLGLPFYLRYNTETFWKNKYEVITDIPGSVKTSDSTFKIISNENLRSSVSGYITVGSFVGYSLPQGTSTGFMGMPIDSAYNVEGQGRFRHAALLYKIKRGCASWSPYRYLYNVRFFKVRSGDQLQFLINDKEFENNSGHYSIEMTVCDTCR